MFNTVQPQASNICEQ